MQFGYFVPAGMRPNPILDTISRSPAAPFDRGLLVIIDFQESMINPKETIQNPNPIYHTTPLLPKGFDDVSSNRILVFLQCQWRNVSIFAKKRSTLQKMLTYIFILWIAIQIEQIVNFLLFSYSELRRVYTRSQPRVQPLPLSFFLQSIYHSIKRQISEGVHEVWSDTQTKKQRFLLFMYSLTYFKHFSVKQIVASHCARCKNPKFHLKF